MNRIRATLVLGLSALAACGDGTGPDSTVEGAFTLVEANGQTLPAVIYAGVWTDADDNEFQIEALVEEGELALTDGSYTFEILVDVTADGEILVPDEPVSESGSYTVDGGTIEFTAASGESVTGTVDGDEIEMSASDPEYGSYTLTFRK